MTTPPPPCGPLGECRNQRESRTRRKMGVTDVSDIVKQSSMALGRSDPREPRPCRGKLAWPQDSKAGSYFKGSRGPSGAEGLGQGCKVGSSPCPGWPSWREESVVQSLGWEVPAALFPPVVRMSSPRSSGGCGCPSCSLKGVGCPGSCVPQGARSWREESRVSQSREARPPSLGDPPQPQRGPDLVGMGQGHKAVTPMVTSSWARGSAPLASHVSSGVLLKEPR